MLTFNLKKEWFDKIKSGEKTHEYREVKDYWTVRLQNWFDLREDDLKYLQYGKIIMEDYPPFLFRLGYTNEYLFARMLSLEIKDGKETDLKLDGPVYDIEFELIKEGK